jgi:hypothetical protein
MKNLLKKISFAIGIMFCSMNVLCDAADEPNINDSFCDYDTVINADIYKDLQSAQFEFVNAEIVDDCLTIEIGASGCDGDTWEFKLVDSGAVDESFPEQRFLKLQLVNDELCTAFFQRTISFDLTALRIQNNGEVILNIDGFDRPLNYIY